MLDHLLLHGVEVHGRHGVFDFEGRNVQRFVSTVAVTAGESWRLIEKLAACLAQQGASSRPGRSPLPPC
ncbi:hypothetical protein [Plastoroseomonas arctica]|uniref:hypothetical protein n=1 Tax=Plastoroseomonas arctica TaxID=1509237 RepID=UPI001BA5FAEF|nr:hypothetical protein [Plastoroseomonas arctica]